MSIIVRNGITYDTNDLRNYGAYDIITAGTGDVQERFIAILTDSIADAGSNFSTTSTTSLTIGTGSKAFVLAADIPYSVGQFVTAASEADGTDFMFGQVTLYVSATKTVTVNVTDVGGSGTLSDWNFNISGVIGPAGSVTFASVAELNIGTEDAKSISPDVMAGSIYGERFLTYPSATTFTAIVEDGFGFITVPLSYNGFNIVDIEGSLVTAGVTGTMDVDVFNVTSGQDILSTPLTFASAAVVDNGAAVIDAAQDDLTTGDIIRVDVNTLHSGTAAQGMLIILTARKP